MWSDDLGATWNENENGAIHFPEDTGAALARVWQLRPDSADRPDVVWAGCEPHSLWRSTDGGCSFELVRGLHDHPHRPTWEPGGGGGAVHTVLPDPASDRVTIAMSTGGVYVSEDGGQKWEPRNKGITVVFGPDPLPEYGQCVHKVAVDASGPDRMYAQNHFGVFRTDDAGVSWTSIAEGLPVDFGFPVVASPHTPGTAWVVPLVADMQRVPPDGRLRVHRTRDAGETWTEVGQGLPDGELERRHARRLLRRRPRAHRPLRRHPRRLRLRQRRRGRHVHAGRRPPARRPRRCGRCRSAVTVQVLLPGALASLAGGAKHLDVEPAGGTLADLLDALAAQHPLLARRIRDETGQVRRFVNVYVDGDDVRFEGGLATTVRDGAEVQVLPSVAGG